MLSSCQCPWRGFSGHEVFYSLVPSQFPRKVGGFFVLFFPFSWSLGQMSQLRSVWMRSLKRGNDFERRSRKALNNIVPSPGFHRPHTHTSTHAHTHLCAREGFWHLSDLFPNSSPLGLLRTHGRYHAKSKCLDLSLKRIPVTHSFLESYLYWGTRGETPAQPGQSVSPEGPERSVERTGAGILALEPGGWVVGPWGLMRCVPSCFFS